MEGAGPQQRFCHLTASTAWELLCMATVELRIQVAVKVAVACPKPECSIRCLSRRVKSWGKKSRLIVRKLRYLLWSGENCKHPATLHTEQCGTNLQLWLGRAGWRCRTGWTGGDGLWSPWQGRGSDGGCPGPAAPQGLWYTYTQ